MRLPSFTHVCVYCEKPAVDRCAVCEAPLCAHCAVRIGRKLYCRLCGNARLNAGRKS